MAYLPLNTKVEVLEGYVFGQKRVPPVEQSKKHDALRVAMQIEQEDERTLTPERLGNKALLLLLEQKLEQNERAIELLSEAVTEDPRNAKLLSDLAAAHIASTWPDPPGEFRALAAANRAVRLEPDLPEARFNLALALEESGLFRQAERAWLDYLRLDSQSGWAADAREHLNNLRQPSGQEQWRKVIKKQAQVDPSFTTLAFIYFQAAREDAMEEVLARWATLQVEGNQAEAARELEMARKIGVLLVNSHYDHTVSDAVSVIAENNDGNGQESLWQAHAAYGKGLQFFRMGRTDLAIPQLKSAAAKLSGTGSPLEHWANLVLAEIACRESRFDTSAELVQGIREHANLTRYQALNDHVIFVEGVSQFLQLNLQEARQTFTSFSSTWDLELKGAARLYLARIDAILGDHRWFYRNTAAWDLSRFSTSRYTIDLFIDTADALAREYPEAAFYLLSEALEASREREDIGTEVGILGALVRLEYRTGNISLTQRRLADLDYRIKGLDQSAYTRRLALEHGMIHCEMNLASPAACVDVLTEAIEFYEQNDLTRLLHVYGLRAGIYKKMGDSVGQENDLSKGIGLYSGLREPYGLPLSRLSQAQLLLKEMVVAQLSRHNIHRALEFEEVSRAIVLPQENRNPPQIRYFGYSGSSFGRYSYSEFLKDLPPRMTLVEIQVSDNQLSAWIFRHREVYRVDLPTSRKALEQHLRHQAPAHHRLTQPRIATSQLSAWLIQPLLPWLPDEGDLFFLPDLALNSVSFEDLKNPKTRQPLDKTLGVGVISHLRSDFSLNGDVDFALEVIREALFPGALNRQLLDKTQFAAERVASSLPQNIAIVEYALLDRQFCAWILRNGKIDFLKLDAESNQIKEELDDLLLAIRKSRPVGVDKLLTSLHERLVAPALPYLSESNGLVIVPDDMLAAVPFTALKNSETGRYLIEDFSVSVSPSASLYLAHRNSEHPSGHSKWTVMALSNPDPVGSLDQSTLRGAGLESRHIVRLFPGSELFEGQKARTPDIYPSLEKHEVTHFAAHWDPRRLAYDDPVLSNIPLIGPNVRLVVLAACQTAIDPLRRSPNGWGLVDRLLARGAPAVVASLWRVDDLATKHLLVKFYEHLREGKDGAGALRAAQLDLLRGEDRDLRDPSKWAGFQVFGYGGI